MKLLKLNPKKSLNKAFLKQRPLRSEIDLFKVNLIRLLDKVDEIEREENQKNHIRDFLRDTWYKETNEINTKDTKDLVIHSGKTNKDKVSVIIEAKRPGNKTEMISEERPNAKALHELVLYYLRERIEENNIDIKYLIATNVHEWYIFDASFFEKIFFKNKSFVKQYEEWRDGKKVTKDTNLFYYEIARPFIDQLEEEIPCTYFDIRSYEQFLRNKNEDDDKNLIALQKLLSPHFLLRVPFASDSNSLDEKFYKELLYIVGLEEVKEGSKTIIRRREKDRQPGSLIENAINILTTEDALRKVKDKTLYGQTRDEQLFGVALELSLTWINRLLFLKLLEGQLIAYHKGEDGYRYLNSEMIKDYDELYKLFHQVLARDIPERSDSIQVKYSRVPYLNSSLFEISELEDTSIKINSLDNSETLRIFNTTVLTEEKNKYTHLPALDYLFRFFDAFDFASEGKEDIQDDNKTLINASVLGKVFEKINGYKEGSVFTPGFITMYMCHQSIRLAVIQKFRDVFSWNIEKFEDIKNYLADRRTAKDILEFNAVINSLRICDIAVGSGHFLVSALNELIAIKFELGLLADSTGTRFRDFEITIENDELIVTNNAGDIFEYRLQNGKPANKEMQRLQETLFHEKQTLIENCLFGVDINPNSVKICRLRLWIELLKNAYYKFAGTLSEAEVSPQLETLPNIDINIKCGNSIVSRFPLDADLSKALKSIKYDIKSYRGFVTDYKNEKSREVKRGLQLIIDGIKADFRTEIYNNDPKILKLNKLSGELFNLLYQIKMFDENEEEKLARIEKQHKLEAEIQKLNLEIETIKNNTGYKNAFEFRFEFPEVLNNDGDFEGFDLILGNPPYIQLQSMGAEADFLASLQFETFSRTGDIYSLFVEQGTRILKKSGYLSFITSNKWMRADYGLKTRKFLSESVNPLLLIDFGMVLVFESATVLSNILLLQKSENENVLEAVRIPNDFNTKSSLISFVNSHKTSISIDENACVIHPENVLKIKLKVEKQGIRLKQWSIQINYGIKTGLNEAFIINEETKTKIISEDPDCAALIKPILRGQDIKAWKPAFANLWVIYVPKGFTIKKNLPKDDKNYVAEPPPPRYGNMEFDDAWYWFSNNYYAISYHLLPYRKKAQERQDKGDYWWEQRACSYLDEFEKPKIIYPNMTKFLPFVYDESSFLTNQKCFIITSQNNDLKYLTAFFNSKLFKFCFKDNFPELLGNTFELSKVFFEQIPVKQLSSDEIKPFDMLVDQILQGRDKGFDTTHFEKKVDRLIYQLYNLTEEEMRIVELG